MRRRVGGVSPSPPDVRDVNQAEYATQLTRALGLQNRVPGHLEPDIGLSVTLDDYTKPEFWWARQGSRWQNRRSVGIVAAQYGFVQVIAPVGTLCVLERVLITNQGAGVLSFDYGFATADAAVGGGGVGPLDDRGAYLNQAQSVSIVWGNAAAPAAPPNGYVQIPGNTTHELRLDQILTGAATPAGVIGCWKLVCGTLATAFEVVTVHRERYLLPSERATW